MKIGGFIKSSLIDFPGKVAAVIFTQGCNFRCPFCHNPELVEPKRFSEPVEEATIWSFLAKRRGQLGGVVITGGEPTLQADLLPFSLRLKEMGFAVKLDTNGSNPNVLKKLFVKKAIDYVAMDIKAPFEKYAQLSWSVINIKDIQKSIKLIIESGVDHEFRTTVLQPVLTEEDIRCISELVKDAKRYKIKSFQKSAEVLDNRLTQENSGFSEVIFEKWQKKYGFER